MQICSNPPTNDEYDQYKKCEIMYIKCFICDNVFGKSKSELQHEYKKAISKNISGMKLFFCTQQCFGKYTSINNIECNCTNCGIKIIKRPCDFKKIKNAFCSKSCAATYNNAHKKHGTRRSKLEVYLERRIKEVYGDTFAIFNNKEIINSELDIYIPSLKLAFELNGIFHYEPIFGKEKLQSIKNNDDRKFQACLEKDIELCIIDTSTHKYITDKTCSKYLEIIENIINKKLI